MQCLSLFALSNDRFLGLKRRLHIRPGINLRIRNNISSLRLSRMTRRDVPNHLRIVIPCTSTKACSWHIVAARRDTSRERTRCSACGSSYTCVFSETVLRLEHSAASAMASTSLQSFFWPLPQGVT